MNVLDMLGAEVVACQDFGLNRPFATVQPWDVQALYFNANRQDDTDPIFLVDGPGIMRETAKAGYAPCIWVGVPRQTTGGKEFAEWASAQVAAFSVAQPVAAVMFDNEKVPLQFQADYIDRWDQLRPWRPTIYSVEPFQDASDNDHARMLRRNAKSVPAGRGRVRKVTYQCYAGGMQPHKPRDVADFLRVRGLTDADLCPTIDPAQPAAYIGSALACGQRGAVLFAADRMPR